MQRDSEDADPPLQYGELVTQDQDPSDLPWLRRMINYPGNCPRSLTQVTGPDYSLIGTPKFGTSSLSRH